MDMQKHLENALNIVKSEPLIVIGGGFVVFVLNLVSIGILSGPLLGGYLLMMVHMLRDNKKPKFDDLFTGFSRFSQLFPFFFLSVLIIIGFMFLVLPGIVMMTVWLYVLMLMADKKMSLGQAMAESKAKVMDKGFFMHLVFAFMITIVPAVFINLIAAVIPPLELVQFLLMPLQCACLASLYLEQFHTKSETGSRQAQNHAQMGSPPPLSEENGVRSTNLEDQEKELPVTPPPPKNDGA